MTNDQKSTIAGAIIAVGAAIAVFFPQFGEVIQKIAEGIAILATLYLGHLTNKPDKL